MVDYIYQLIYIESSLYLWDEDNMIIVDDLFDVLLSSVCKCFTKNKMLT